MRTLLLMFLMLSVLLSATAFGEEPIDFERQIWPIFQARCNACHGEEEQEGQLRLDAKEIAFSGGVSGPSIKPKHASDSLLLKRVLGEGDAEQMPLDDDPLSEEQIALIRRWIDQGAPWPKGVGSNATSVKPHWAYIRPEVSSPGDVSQPAWVANPIDAYVLARLDKEGLKPSPPAEKAKLLRRVSLDLIGLPPTIEQLKAFLADTSETAYETAVDQLLASPRYGERWARQWLDLARYADSNGYQADQYRNVWPFRDWVINAMNEDMPFDQFTIEQLAGDLLPSATVEQRIATGFHRLTTCNVEAGVDPEENRINQVIDRVNTTGYVWLGSTIECAQCHNHKYDPFTQRDYYQLLAYFNNTPLEVEGNGVTYNFVGPKMDLPLAPDQQQELDRRKAALAAAQKELDAQIADRTKDLSDWIAAVSAKKDDKPEWTLLTCDSFTSQGNATHEVLEDGSLLISGARPETDIYTLVSGAIELKEVTGFKLETLTHESLPGKGPGRHHDERPNFVLNEFTVTVAGKDGPAQPIALRHAEADYSQPQYPVAGAIDGKANTGWAIHSEFGKPHEATFIAASPIKLSANARFTFQLDQHHGECRTIGRFRLSAMTGSPPSSTLPKQITAILAVEEAKRSKKQQQALSDYFVNLDASIVKQRKSVDALKKRVDALKPITTLVMVEEEKPRESHIFKRGNFLTPGEAVTPAAPARLHALPQGAPQNRLGLAQWIAHTDNPLTPRVVVNRWWAEFFGHGIVATLEDFGSQCEPPTHPQLLDWLARQFVDHGWSMKHLHKRIVM